MTRKFSHLTKKMSAKDRAEIKTRSTKLLVELPLEQFRSARSLTRDGYRRRKSGIDSD